MKWFKIMLVLLVMGLMISACSNEAVQASDEVVEEVEMIEDVPVVVAGTVSAARILHGLGVVLAAVPETDRYLPQDIENLPTIGLPMNPDIERVKSFDPDLFVTDATLEERLAESMEIQGINTAFIKTSGYADILMAIETLGLKFDKTAEASNLVDEIKNLEKEALAIAQGNDPVSVAVIFGTPESFMLATNMSFVGDMVNKLGAENITDQLQEARGPYVPFSLETLAEYNPDVILRMTHVNPEQSRKMFEDAFSQNPFYDALEAVKSGRVYDLDSNYFGVVASLDCGEAIKMLAEILYVQ